MRSQKYLPPKLLYLHIFAADDSINYSPLDRLVSSPSSFGEVDGSSTTESRPKEASNSPRNSEQRVLRSVPSGGEGVNGSGTSDAKVEELLCCDR